MIRKIIAGILGIVLLVTFVVPALAEVDIRYVNTDKLKVYREQDKKSEVIAKLKGGAKLLIEQDLDAWVTILVEDTKRGGQMLGYIEAKYLSYNMPAKYCKHDWSEWEIIKEVTCTEKGKRTRTCSICGEVKTESIKAPGHKWSKWKVVEEATCKEQGERTRTCKVCGNVEVEDYYSDHVYGSWTTTKDPSCSEKGTREHTCKVCGKTEEQAIDKLPHDYAWKIIVKTTDHSSGTRAKVCRECGYETAAESFDPEGTLRRKDRGEEVRSMQQLLVDQGYLNDGGADGVFGGGTEKALMQYQKDRGLNPDGIGWPQTIKSLAHDFGPWETVKKMTRAEDGIRARVCRDCGFEQREAIASGTVFEKGRRGEDVRAMQRIMKELGYEVGSLDGIYGKKLDAAMEGFAADHQLTVEKEKIRPADMDAAVNAWLEQLPEDQWKGEGGADSPVNLAMSMTSSAGADDSGISTYSWSLTNLGGEDATFTALLLHFGDAPDFRTDNLVMQLDGTVVKKNGGNSASGSFIACEDWGEGKMSFTAVAINEKTGELWQSNTVDFADNSPYAIQILVPD